MKHITALALATVILSAGLAGCAKKQEQKPANSPNMVREVQDTVTGMAGGAAFKAGQKGKAKIKAINQQHNAELDKALQD